jgi:hypothetical protein
MTLEEESVIRKPKRVLYVKRREPVGYPISAAISTILPRASRKIGLGAASGLLLVSTSPGDVKTRHGAVVGRPEAFAPEAFRCL